MSHQEKKAHSGWLMSGAGNTFALEITSAEQEIPALKAKKICEQFKVDGYLGLIPGVKSKFKWNFYNSDGSDAEFCGNAARCAQEFLRAQKNLSATIHETKAGTVLAWSEEENTWVKMPTPKIIDDKKTVFVEGHAWTGFFCDTGVPHFVLQNTKLRHDEWKKLSRRLRNNIEFGNRGSNITWVQSDSEAVIQAVTYERGVEDFTQACGTGAMAASLWKRSLSPAQKDFEIAMPGGRLRTTVHETGWMMTGPVEKIGDWSLS